jgi:hypothetical protein
MVTYSWRGLAVVKKTKEDSAVCRVVENEKSQSQCFGY